MDVAVLEDLLAKALLALLLVLPEQRIDSLHDLGGEPCPGTPGGIVRGTVAKMVGQDRARGVRRKIRLETTDILPHGLTADAKLTGNGTLALSLAVALKNNFLFCIHTYHVQDDISIGQG